MKTLKQSTQLYLLIFFQFAIIAATSMSQPFWPLIIQANLGDHPTNLSLWNLLIYTAPLIGTILTAPLWGMLGDRVGYKKMILRATLGLFITQGLIAFAPTPLVITLLRFIQGLFCGYIAASQAIGVRLVPHHRQPWVISLLQSAVALAIMVGPILGGVILTYLSYPLIFYGSSLICLVSFVVFLFCIEESRAEQVNHKSEVTANTEGLSPQAKLTLGAIFLAQTARFMITPLLLFYALEQLHEQTFSVGLLSGVSGLALFLTSPLVGSLQSKRIQRQASPYSLVIMGLVLATVSYCLLAGSTHLAFALWERALWGIALGGILPLLSSIAIMNCHSSIKGKVLGYVSSANKGGNLLGIALGIVLYQQAGIQVALFAIGGMYFLTLLYVVFLKVRFEGIFQVPKMIK